MKETTYTIRFARPVIETLDVKVSASSEEEAIFEAAHLFAVKDLSEKQWSGQFDDENYSTFIESVTAEDDIEHNRLNGENKYLILLADMYHAQGSVVVQPWLMAQNPIMIADFCEDWKSQLTALEQGELEAFAKALQPGKSAQIIPFPNAKKNQEPDDRVT